VRVVFMGTPEYAVPTLEHLLLDGYEVAAVYTQPDKTAGRGRAAVTSPVKKAALERGLPVVQPVSFKDAEVVKQLTSFQPDVIVVLAFGQVLPQPVLDIPALGCINIHPSLLPKYRGAAPVVAAILSGDEFTGVTVMGMAEGLDTGDILMQAQVPISAQDTAGTLTGKLSLIAARLVLETLPRLAKGEIIPRPQDESLASYYSQMAKSDGEINWNLPAADIWRRVRAFNPWPGSHTQLEGKQLKIIKAVPLAIKGKAGPGRVIALDEKEAAFGIGTGKGILGILEVQLEGKRAMSAADFLRGQRQLIGEKLPSGKE